MMNDYNYRINDLAERLNARYIGLTKEQAWEVANKVDPYKSYKISNTSDPDVFEKYMTAVDTTICVEGEVEYRVVQQIDVAIGSKYMNLGMSSLFVNMSSVDPQREVLELEPNFNRHATCVLIIHELVNDTENNHIAIYTPSQDVREKKEIPVQDEFTIHCNMCGNNGNLDEFLHAEGKYVSLYCSICGECQDIL